MNPITVFKDINRRIQVEDHLAGVKEQAHADAARLSQTAAARVAQMQQFEAQQLDAGWDAEDRFALEELQQAGLGERNRADIEARAAAAATTAAASARNTHFDNAKGMADLSSATNYLGTVGQTDLVPALAAEFAAREKKQKRAGFEAALKGVKTVAEYKALASRPEFKEFLADPEIAPQVDVARAGAEVEDQRYNTVEARRRASAARAAAADAEAKDKKGKPAALSAAQERILVQNISKVKLALRNAADEEERGLLQEELSGLEAIQARTKRAGTGAGSSLMADPALRAELLKAFRGGTKP